jgi:phage-related protein
MTRSVKGLCGAAGLLAAMSLGFAASAPAQAERSNCAECNRPATKVNTSYRYKTVQRVKNVTQYKDVNRTKYQKHVNRIVNVTRIQPVTRVSVVTRVHNRMVVLHQTQHVAQTATLPTRTVTTGKTIQVNHPTEHRNCNC